jgi:hypothetical protein
MEMPKPAPGHLKLHKLAGTWQGEEQMYPSPWDPKGGTAKGKTTSRVSLSGFAVIGDYEQERHGVITFAGHSVFTFDPNSAMYMLHWFDCMGSPPELFAGSFSGDVLTVAHGGPQGHARLTYDVSNPKELVSSMEMSQDGRTWKKFFDGRYKRL